MKSIYEMLLERSKTIGDNFIIAFNKEMIGRVFADWQKIETGQRLLIEGRLKSRQKYPDLNDLISFLNDNRSKANDV